MNFLKRNVVTAVGILLSLGMFAHTTYAKVRVVTGNNSMHKISRNVYDSANLLTSKTANEIDEINSNKLSTVKGNPQLVVWTTNKVNGTVTDY